MDPDVRSIAAAVHVSLRSDSCDGTILYESVVPTATAPRNLVPGAYFVRAVATSADCVEVGFRCEPVVLPSSVPVRVVISRAQGRLLCAPSMCARGLCVATDSGTNFDASIDVHVIDRGIDDVRVEVSTDTTSFAPDVHDNGVTTPDAADTATPCPTMCNGVCVDLQHDRSNCRSCGNVCGIGQNCVDAACVCSRTQCRGTCTDVMSDVANCGVCGNVCQARCENGACAGAGYASAVGGAVYSDVCSWIGSASFLSNVDSGLVELASPAPMVVYGRSYNRMSISSNGFISFTQRYIGGAGSCLIVPQLGVAVAPFWEDLILTVEGICVAARDTPTGRQVGVGWNVSDGNGGRTGFAVYYNVNDTSFDYVYAGNIGRSATIGIQSDIDNLSTSRSCGMLTFIAGQSFHWWPL